MIAFPDNREFRVLLPFGVSLGDELIPAGLFNSSGPQSKLAIYNVTCPFFGTRESTLHVSRQELIGLRISWISSLIYFFVAGE